MKKIILSLFVVSFHSVLIAQESTGAFPEAEFKSAFDKLICSGKNDFADLIDKQVVVNGDTSWKSKLSLPGFKNSNFSKSKSMIDYAYVAYQSFATKEEAIQYYQEAKKTIYNSSTGCVLLEPAKVPVQVNGVDKYDLWKSTKSIPYKGNKNVFLYVSLNLSENEVVVNTFLKQGL